MTRVLALAAATSLALLAAVLPAAASERWSGSVELPGGQRLAFTVTFEADAAGQATATIDIPAQGAMGLPLQNVVLARERIAFAIPSVDAAWSFTPEGDGTKARGSLVQRGMTFPASLEKLADDAPPPPGSARPQQPRPPFPYLQWEARYENPKDGTKLAGTLTLPEGPGPHPAVILITGSGPQDRDESLLGHRPFWVLADHLTRRGIAVLRVDDRGVGGSSGATLMSTAEDSAADVSAGLDFLRGLRGVDRGRIGLLGHSEGGIVAPLVAARRKDVAFVVMLAGTGVPGKDVLREQLAALLRASGVPADAIDRQVELQQAFLAKVAAGAPAEEQLAAARALVAAQAGDAVPAGMAPEDFERGLAQAAAAQSMQANTPWFKSFLELDPRVALRSVTCPVLALNGELDAQVVADQNLPEIGKALAAAGNRDVTLKRFPGLNHLFQHGATGGVAEYAAIEETMSPEVLDLVATWILERTRRR